MFGPEKVTMLDTSRQVFGTGTVAAYLAKFSALVAYKTVPIQKSFQDDHLAV